MFSAQDVKNLREKTGAGMMDCKKALDASSGNIDEAITWLREKGISKAAKKADRIAAEGIATVLEKDNKAIIIEVNSETDFVSSNTDFKNFVNNLANIIIDSDATDVESALKVSDGNQTVNDIIVSAIAKFGEKISLRRFTKITKDDNDNFGLYIHQGGKIAVLSLVNGSNKAIADEVAMHVCAMNPLYLDITSVDQNALEKEKVIFKEQAINEGKSSDIAEKMVQGRVKKYYKETCLVEQPFVINPDISVGQYVKDNGGSIISMVRYAVGEGIEKKEENFADEVNKQING